MAPQIDFPTGIQAQGPQIEGRPTIVVRRIQQAGGAVAFTLVTAGSGDTGQLFATGDLPGCAALQQALIGGAHIEVGARRSFDQL